MIPIPIPTSGRTYAAIFAFFLFCWPLVLYTGMDDKRHTHNPTVEVVALIALMIGSYVLNYLRCSSPRLSYWGGLCLIAGFWRSGCVQITAMIIIPLLFIVHGWLLVMSLASLASGKATAEEAFLRTCRRFAGQAFEIEAPERDSNTFRGGL